MKTDLDLRSPPVIAPERTPVHRVWIGVLFLVIGFALVAVLGGAVVKHLVDAVTIGALIGMVAGLVGIALVVRGWQEVLKPLSRRWARVATATLGTLLIAQFLLLPAVMALDATHRPKATGTGRTPADLGLAYQDVRFETADGFSIAGWWLPTRNGAAIVVLPGAGSTREAALDHAALLWRAGFGALVLDLRGHGESDGPRNEFGWGAERDVSAAVDWLDAQPTVTRAIGVLGLSMGGEVALTAAALDPRIRAVVAEGASARTWSDARAIPGTNPIGLANEWLMFGMVDLLSPTRPPLPLLEAIGRIEAPVLLITGNETHEVAVGPIYRDANPAAVRLWALPDTPHIGALRVHPDEYRDRVLEAFQGL